MPSQQPSFYKTGLTFLAALAIGAGGAVIGANGAKIASHEHAAAVVHVNSLVPWAATTTPSISVTGASVGDHCDVSVTTGDFLSTTSTGRVWCRVTAANVATLTFQNASGTGAAFQAGTSTFDIDTWGH